MVVLACTAGLSAQVAESDASAKLKQFEQNLANALKRPGVVSLKKMPQLMAAPVRVCSIPLLKVGPDPSFKSNMPVIMPDPNIDFSIRLVTPPAPSCDERERK
jgi:hypothetical protein